MRIAVFLMTAVLQVVCKDKDVCEIFPKNPDVPYGSDLTMFLKAPSSSDCRSETPFNSSRIFWTLNKIKIDQRFYDFNTTLASVSIHNITVEKGTVECFLNITTPLLLHGTFIRTHPLIRRPENISCVGKFVNPPWPTITCIWDHDPYPTDIKYTIHVKQLLAEYKHESWKKHYTIPEYVELIFGHKLTVSVCAQNPYEDLACSSEVTYSDLWNIVPMDSPTDVIAEPLPTGIRVSWKNEQRPWTLQDSTECETRLCKKGSCTEPVMKHLKSCLISTVEMTEVKSCTNYTVSVRSRYNNSVWSTWSHAVTALSYLNVSSLQLHLWRSKSVLNDRGKRTVHLMWTGVSPSCKAFDEYCIYCDSLRLSKCCGPYQNHTFITLDEKPHRITVAVIRNETRLNEASIEVPAMAEEVNLPPVGNISVFLQHGDIHITWEKPSLPVSGYIIVWNSTAKNYMWQQTQETSFVLKGEPSTYTISLTPLYKDGPGNQITLHNCGRERNLTEVSQVQVIAVSDKHAEIRWIPTQRCAFVLNYTVFYQTNNDPKIRNITVGPDQHHVVLENLQSRTTYSVYIVASTASASSKSLPLIFSTKISSVFLIMVITCCVGMILLSILAVMIQRKLLSKKIPDPRFSSLSMWPSDHCRKPWSLFSVPGARDTEKILTCHIDNEVISVSPSSKNNMATVNALADSQKIATQEISQTENTPLAASFSNKGQLPFGGKEQRVPSVSSLDLHTSGICPLPLIHSPYKKQTPLNSPVESPTQPQWSDETEALLTPKLRNTTYFTSYVTMDMVEPRKHPSK
ncbi:interleukin-31 receptor subunit alpha-like isoform X2 [Neoarius graeffei]|uniref:interleukin-31 receptor subunit alpha-like isoform X2 n=1 Tax=Neoarius graeffei TaxID=443677 RepID=UPI00298C555B|nr:interleukin-31 receptor subunit alpha-like isoform X2 [Neoarius graeffei]